MKFKIHYELQNGEEDSLIIEGDTIKELQKIAKEEMEKRPDLRLHNSLKLLNFVLVGILH